MLASPAAPNGARPDCRLEEDITDGNGRRLWVAERPEDLGVGPDRADGGCQTPKLVRGSVRPRLGIGGAEIAPCDRFGKLEEIEVGLLRHRSDSSPSAIASLLRPRKTSDRAVTAGMPI